MAKSDKPKRPPINKDRIGQRLDRAAETKCLVGVRRWIPKAEHVEGFVVGQSPDWVLFARLSARIEIDGWIAIRRADIQSVALYPTEDCFEIKALKARGQWPPAEPAQAGLDSVAQLLADASATTPLVGIFREFERPNACWIGAVHKTTAVTTSLLEVNVAGGWARKPRHFDLDDITRLDFGGGYEEALHLVAGAPPRISPPRKRPGASGSPSD
jgi:hypothetical protein